MATTTTSATSSGLSAAATAALNATPAAIAAANKANAQKIMTSLGAGSGVDTASLAQNLVDAERVPKETAINGKISKNDARVAGYSAISYVMSQVQTAFAALKDKSNFNVLTATSSNTNALGVSATTSAAIGSHEIQISQLAKGQRSVSDGFSSPNIGLNGGAAMTLNLSIGTTSASAPKVQITTTQGDASAATTESSVVTFPSLNNGQSVTVGGLTYTSTGTTAAADVAAAFASLADGAIPANTSTGTFSGKLVGFSSGTTSNGAVTFTSVTANTNVADLKASPAGISIGIDAGNDTPQEIVKAINLSTAANAAGVKASLANTGDPTKPYKIVLSGALGASNAFNIASDNGSGVSVAGLVFDSVNSQHQDAVDAKLTVNGISYTRSTNTVTDVLTGVTLDLKNTTSLASPVTLDLTRDDTTIKANMNALVVAYNDAMSMLNVVSDPKSKVDTYGATLVGDSTVRSLRDQLRSMFTGNSTAAAGATTVKSMWQMGYSIDEKGVMTLDSTKLDTAIQNNYSDVMQSFTGGYNKLSTYVSMPNAGIANDAYTKITKLLGPTGAIQTQSDNVTKQNTKYADDLTKLQTRMDALLARYTKQFSAMNSIVGSVNSQKTSLKSTFDGMMATYTKN
jgi:flagellar hook-associated protein 2